MKNYIIYSLIALFFTQISVAQVGINTETPEATLEVVAPDTTLNNENVLKVRNVNSTDLLTVSHNGNVNIGKALKPDGQAGNSGEILVSQGPNLPPVWQKNIIEDAAIQIFSAQRNTISTQVVNVNAGRRMDFPTINTLPITDIATWNPVSSLFTANKKGIYQIIVGTNAMNLTDSDRNFALFVETSNGFQTGSGLLYSTGSSLAFSTSVTYTTILNSGQTIYFTGTSGNSTWQQGSSFVSILFSELP